MESFLFFYDSAAMTTSAIFFHIWVDLRSDFLEINLKDYALTDIAKLPSKTELLQLTLPSIGHENAKKLGHLGEI